MEHRQAQRIPANISVILRTADGVTCEGSIKNVSAIGAGIELSQGTLTRGSMVRIQVLSSSQKHKKLANQAVAYVVRHADNEFGLLWVDNEELTPMFGGKRQQEIPHYQEYLIA